MRSVVVACLVALVVQPVAAQAPSNLPRPVAAPVATPPPADTRPFSVVNDSPFTLRTLHVWPSGLTARGVDRLGNEMLGGGRGWPMHLPLAAGCRWMVVATYTDGDGPPREGRVTEVDVCTTPELRLPPAAGLVRGGGTGFVVSAAGHIVTNEHVVRGCGSMGLRRDGRETRLRVIGTATGADLALLQAPAPIGQPLPLRSRGKAPRLAEPLVVLGYRELFLLGGQMLALTGRVVAREGQDIAAAGRLDRTDRATFLHDARTWGGNSGGPILDYAGAVMGVHTARTSHGGNKDEPVVPLAIGIRIDAVYELLARHDVRPLPEPPRRAEPDLLAEEAEPSVLRLLCFSG
jgi:S1-C subfamily serine protease